MSYLVMLTLRVLYFMIPGAFANSTPVVGRGILKRLAVPVDMGIKFRGRPLFGKNKTVRGFILGVLSSIVVVIIQRYLFRFEVFRQISLVDYSLINPILLGFLIGFGALFGDLCESFFKRQRGLAPGKSWVPFDQLDSVVGVLIFILPVYIPPWDVVITGAILAFIAHIGVKHIGFWIGLNNAPW